MSGGTPGPHDPIDAYYDDALDDAARAAFEQHLVACARCQARLDELMALDAVTADARATAPAPAAPAPVVDLAAHRRRRRAVFVTVAALAAAAAVLLVWWRRDDRRRDDGALALIELAPERRVEARLSWAPAAAHRPYTTLRGDGEAEPGARAATAALERRGDRQGLAAAWLLAGSPERALEALAGLQGPDAEADRAAALLALGRAEDALAAADAAVAAAPDHAAARWNRALALRQLGLPAAAAAEWRRVAGRGEPGWADEAAARAAALERDLAVRRERDAGLGRLVASCARGPLDGASVLDTAPAPAVRRALRACAAAGAPPDLLRQLAPAAARVDALGGDAPLAPRLQEGRLSADDDAAAGDAWGAVRSALARARSALDATPPALDAAAEALAATDEACTPPARTSACLERDLVAGRLSLARGDARGALAHARAVLELARAAGVADLERDALSLWRDAARALGATAVARAVDEELALATR